MFGRRLFLWGGFAALVATTTAACSDDEDSPTEPTEPAPQGPPNLEIAELVVGTGAEALGNSSVFIQYAVWRFDPNGTDRKGEGLGSSAGQPYAVTIGGQGNIVGLGQGIIGMRIGGQRRITIPPNLAYGSTGDSTGRIRPNEWLVFEVQLLSVA